MMTSTKQAAKDRATQLAVRCHTLVFDLTRGKVGGELGGMPAVKLTTTGRKSGKLRSTMLTTPLSSADGGIVLVASYGGDPRHPAWYHNLTANPEVELVTGGRKFRATARTASMEEKAELWPRVTATYKGYAGYQERTDREIPLVICTPNA